MKYFLYIRLHEQEPSSPSLFPPEFIPKQVQRNAHQGNGSSVDSEDYLDSHVLLTRRGGEWEEGRQGGNTVGCYAGIIYIRLLEVNK